MTGKSGNTVKSRASQSSMRKYSQEFIELVSLWGKRNQNRSELSRSLALWCFNTPSWYQKFIWKEVDKRIGAIGKAHISEAYKKDVEKAVVRLAGNLRKLDALCLFLLDDGELLAQAYEKLGGSAIRIAFGRKNIPTPARTSSYFAMFNIVNMAARTSSQNWHSFHSRYDSLWTRFTHSKAGAPVTKALQECVDSKVHETISQSLNSGRTVICVDSGLQGTFSLALSSWLAHEHHMNIDRFDIKLLVTYPWLRGIFRNRFISTNPDILVGFEKLLRVS